MPARYDMIIYRDQVSGAFVRRAVWMGDRLDVDPDWLMAVMAFVSAYTFTPAVRTPYSTAW